MKRFLAFVAASLVCAPVVAAEPTADDFLTFWKPLPRQWVVRVKIGDKTAERTWQCRLSETKRSLVCYGSALLQYPAFQSVDGYDPESKRWKIAAFTTAGEHTIIYLGADADALKGKQATFKMEGVVVKPDGKKDTLLGKWIFTIIGNDEWKLVCSGLTLNGDKQRDEEYVFTRKSAAIKGVPREVLKELEYLAGVWNYEGHNLQTKEPMTGMCVYRWAPGEHCLLWEQTWIDKIGLSHGAGIIGWDSSTGRLVEQDMYEGGTFGRHSYRIRPKAWEADSLYTLPNGEATFGKTTMSKRGATEMEYRMVDYLGTLGKPGESWQMTFRKVKPMTASDFQDYGKTMVGSWEGEFVLAGDVPGVGKNADKVKGRATIAWACDKRGLETDWQFGAVSGRTVSFWDPTCKQIKETAFDSAGGVYQGQVFREGDKWVAPGATDYPDGTRRSVTDTLTVVDGGKTHIHEGKVFLNSEKQPDYRDVWKRVK